MRVTDLFASAYVVSFERYQELHEAWVLHSHKLSAVAGAAHLHAIQANHQLDILLRQLESEWAPSSEPAIDFALDLRLSLSECWVLRAYEVVRAAAQQLKHEPDSNAPLFALKRRLELVRIPLAKMEIQQARKAEQPIVLALADGTGPKEYVPDGTYVVPRKICAVSGAVIWCPVDAKAGVSVDICRRDLSDELLALFA